MSDPITQPPVYAAWARSDPATGEIVAWGNSLIIDVPPDALLGQASPDTHYVAAGALVAYTPAQQAMRSECPSPFHVWDNVSMEWTDPRTPADKLAVSSATARIQRDALLAACDWTQLPDSPDASKAAWKTYRQALRDVPSQTGFPATINWPTSP